ncbi:Hpt domain-containing protein [Pacificimonas sp. WHA3]|uniref:Hpt domain-containing protein n=1 Tax=Pacificimonas pallii TaxID=2827236 RepID=A0ABS6SFI0_9SPHN|nr:Hpt domain-containing protein [Pacificimonas pallii]MBV7256691.1 Hpt domain-containing protein [Pacificimonas pallii]
MVSTAIYDIAGGDPAIMEKLLSEFRISIMKSVELLSKSTTPTEWCDRGHRLKGGALAIGAERLAAVAAKIERGDLAGPEALARVEDALQADLPED